MYPRDVQVKTSPVAQLQVFSPEVCPGNVRNPSASPLTSPMLHKKMTTPRKGLGAPSGAKPRRSVEAFTCMCKMFGVFSIAIAAVSYSSLWPNAGEHFDNSLRSVDIRGAWQTEGRLEEVRGEYSTTGWT